MRGGVRACAFGVTSGVGVRCVQRCVVKCVCVCVWGGGGGGGVVLVGRAMRVGVNKQLAGRNRSAEGPSLTSWEALMGMSLLNSRVWYPSADVSRDLAVMPSVYPEITARALAIAVKGSAHGTETEHVH